MYSVLAALLLSPSVWASPVGLRAETPTLAIPAPTESPSSAHQWAAGWKPSFNIHESCNSSLRAQLQQGLDETVELAQHARDHLLRWGHASKFVDKYFGNGSTAHAIGWYDRIIAADKTEMLFRCDDPDRNCETQKGWAGHWRGSNATTETVICPLSFAIRRPLSSVCNLGYTVTGSKLNTYWATDLMHRLFHVPTISEGIVDHYSHGYAGILELAKKDPEKSGIDTDALQYFAIDVWAYDIAAPGVGCTGKPPAESASPSGTSTTVPAATGTTSSAASCHTHDDGFIHCT
ncbi:major allergen Asp f 2-like protein [Metarhizium guizhouense ARSEF 977]|uniref:Major allergen Asp f 2-like protein n=1 Tax=Metarhizium guizhouense (strain ARSEF 977) TaxID=1276136 RepID=A0A0B4G535_METGA|nr:major allergen Asp f 2-like protein [Metarhizium guizhouense ARSEF 977]